MSNSNENPDTIVQASVTITSATLVNVGSAIIGAGCVLLLAKLLQYVGSAFTPALPFIGGGLLFATIVCGFFTMLRLLKQMRLSRSLRLSFAEVYTGVSIFIAMGFFASACMHAFKGDGLGFELWNSGVWAAGLAAVGYGTIKGFISLWNEGAKKV